jgi:glycine cleavage system transcriptional repressor
VAHVAVTALGLDQPGIVSRVTGVLVDHGGNLEDSAMTILGGHFAIMLVVEVPDEADLDGLESALAAEVASLGLTVAVRPVAEVPSTADEPGRGFTETGPSWSVSVHGADRPGIVHRVTALLAGHGANVVDLSTRRLGSGEQAAYVMLLAVTLAPRTDEQALAGELEALAGDLGVDIHVRPDDADVL